MISNPPMSSQLAIYPGVDMLGMSIPMPLIFHHTWCNCHVIDPISIVVCGNEDHVSEKPPSEPIF